MSARHDDYRRDWGQRANAFRPLTETDAGSGNWRTAKPAWQPPRDLAPEPRPGIRERLLSAIQAVRSWCNIETMLLQPSDNRRDIAVFVVGMAWGVMCAIGAMAAWGIHP